MPREVTLTLTWEDVEALYLIVGDRLKLLDLEQHLSPQMLVAPKRAGMSLLQVKLNAALAAALEKAAAKPGAPAPA